MTKEVGRVTGLQFGYVYIGGIPYLPTRVKRFMNKGLGIKLQDIVIYEFDMVDGDRVLSYLKNATYKDGSEIRMVKEFVKKEELVKAQMSDFSDVSPEMRRQLAEEGIVITNNGVFHTPAEGSVPEKPAKDELNIPDEVLELILPNDRRSLAILLQNTLNRATDLVIAKGGTMETREIKELALKLMRWVDDNSMQILSNAESYAEKKVQK